MLPVFLDTCVLLKSYLCDTLLSLAEASVYRPLWSSMVVAELERNLALAAAVRGGAEVLVTENLRDFPPDAVRPYGSEVISQDTFLLDQFDLRPADVLGALRRQASRYRREPRDVAALLAVLGSPGSGCPDFAQACRQVL